MKGPVVKGTCFQDYDFCSNPGTNMRKGERWFLQVILPSTHKQNKWINEYTNNT